jgi:hypothetical protein
MISAPVHKKTSGRDQQWNSHGQEKGIENLLIDDPQFPDRDASRDHDRHHEIAAEIEEGECTGFINLQGFNPVNVFL